MRLKVLIASTLALSGAAALANDWKPVGAAIGDWVVLRSIDPNTGLKFCAAFYSKNPDVVFAEAGLVIDVSAKGPADHYSLQFDDSPAKWKNTSYIDTLHRAIVINQGEERLREAKRLRVKVQSHNWGVAEYDIDLEHLAAISARLYDPNCLN